MPQKMMMKTSKMETKNEEATKQKMKKSKRTKGTKDGKDNKDEDENKVQGDDEENGYDY